MALTDLTTGPTLHTILIGGQSTYPYQGTPRSCFRPDIRPCTGATALDRIGRHGRPPATVRLSVGRGSKKTAPSGAQSPKQNERDKLLVKGGG
jgi:hypothetical protein